MYIKFPSQRRVLFFVFEQEADITPLQKQQLNERISGRTKAKKILKVIYIEKHSGFQVSSSAPNTLLWNVFLGIFICMWD